DGSATRWLVATAALALALGGCSIVGGEKVPVTIYAPMPELQADPGWPALDVQLSVSAPHVPDMLDGHRIAVRPVPGELQVYKGAAWAETPGEQLRAALLEVLEGSGKLDGVARHGHRLSVGGESLRRRARRDPAGHCRVDAAGGGHGRGRGGYRFW